jgi:hypothetical protein
VGGGHVKPPIIWKNRLMKQSDVARIVERLAHTLKNEGEKEDIDFIVNPITVFTQLEIRHPDVVKHLRRFYSGDPYQHVKLWIPKKHG